MRRANSTAQADISAVTPEKALIRSRIAIVFVCLVILLFLLAVLNITLGSFSLSPSTLWRAIIEQGGESTEGKIIWLIRFPRLIAAVVLGGALALSGFLLQTFFNNPIAGPYILGISSGAKLTVAIVMITVLDAYQTVSSGFFVLAAFAGALLSMGFVLLIARRVARMSMLIVCGVMIGYICSAITDFLITFADDANIVNLHNWSRGSFSGIAWGDVGVMTAVVLVTSVVVFLMSKPIGAYQLGENYAQSMGVNVRAFRVMLVVLSSLLAACVTAFAGPVAFVGVAVPHVIKAALKTAKPIVMIPACFLGGAVFCLGCDLIARTAFAPTELVLSSVTAAFGAPVVLYVMIRRRRANRT
ncbi:MAG: FecCD family ABC transporter permease [Thermoleophilia bacterium]|jgi:iron complex transport system permease protein